MPAGTIALTNNSATVGGTGTAFTTELKAGDFIGVTVGGAPYTMIVASIASNTQLTIAQAYNGPTASGLAWYAVPASLMHAITQQTLNDMASNLRGMTLQMDNWQKIYSDAASVTVQRPDRSTFTGPSWGYMATQYTNKASLVNGAVPISQGGTGGKNQAEARTGLGLGTAAQRDGVTSSVDTTAGRLLQVGSFGIGAPGQALAVSGPSLLNFIFKAGIGQFYRNGFDTTYGFAYGASIVATAGDTYTNICAGYSGAGVRVTAGNAVTDGVVYDLWTSRNTTVDTNNFIKRASPIARLTNDVSKMQSDFSVEGQHIISGLVSVNAEAEGVSAEKLSTGVYRITGSLGLSVEGWTIEGPQDNNGNRLCFIENEIDGEALIIRVSSRRFDINTAMIVANEPMDIPAGRWIDLRLQMPEDSAWNNHLREMDPSAAGKEPTS